MSTRTGKPSNDFHRPIGQTTGLAQGQTPDYRHHFPQTFDALIVVAVAKRISTNMTKGSTPIGVPYLL